MSFVLTVWELPAGAPAPADIKAADLLLAQQQAAPEVPSPRIAAFVQALFERFPPDSEGFGDYDAWDGAEHTGPTENFGLKTHGHHFEAAYQHAVVQARRLGLNVYDLQSGEHHLADGRRLPDGEKPFDDDSADAAWRASNWAAAVRQLREATAQGDRCAQHDLGRCFAEGHGVPRHVMLAGVLMQLAGATDDVRRRQRLAILKAWPADMRERQTALRDRLRAAPELLPALDAEVAALKARRKTAPQSWKPASYSTDDWWLLREAAEDGDADALTRLAHALGPHASPPGRPPWPVEPDAHQRCLLLAAARADAQAQRRVAEALLSGRDGWPLNPVEALRWMRRARTNDGRGLDGPIERVARRLADGWDPLRDRPRAEQALHEAMRTQAAPRLALLRSACELDHPEAWRRLGDAYLRGDLGLPKDDIIGAALHLHAQKDLSLSSGELSLARPAALGNLGSFETDDALRLCRDLIGDTAPWQTIARYQHMLDHSTTLQVSLGQDMRSRTEIIHGRKGTAAAAPATRQATAEPTAPAAQAAVPAAGGWHAGHATLLLGAAGPLLLLWAGAGRTASRLGLMVSAGLALHGTWRCGRQLDWSPLKRIAVGVVAAVPGLGLFAAASVLLTTIRRGRGADD
jgi:TPR repeat protein